MQWKGLLITLKKITYLTIFHLVFIKFKKKTILEVNIKFSLFHAFRKFLKSRPKFIQIILIHVGIYKNILQKKLKRL